MLQYLLEETAGSIRVESASANEFLENASKMERRDPVFCRNPACIGVVRQEDDLLAIFDKGDAAGNRLGFACMPVSTDSFSGSLG
ncbi:hypothetical protein O7623_00290 [Solwaraspora sp. WMMD791]|uniref:hypothetical protein n=1 Tax=Solwaraspora sp. WMMD791 TaxID=3016086 RepID=UPI00249BEA00|nr:hypothetical protein [Solwaraspora sp. WMMD791]WFE27697.1 hypothetical protein O7623_00290 [Solwaraspora sp. WMMD791]